MTDDLEAAVKAAIRKIAGDLELYVLLRLSCLRPRRGSPTSARGLSCAVQDASGTGRGRGGGAT